MEQKSETPVFRQLQEVELVQERWSAVPQRWGLKFATWIRVTLKLLTKGFET